MVKNIIVKNVTKQFRSRCVLKDVQATFRNGEVSGIRGVNGSGKTMLLRLISGLILPSSGEIYYDQARLGKDFEFPHSLGFLIESPSFWDSYSSYQNLSLLASIKKKVSEREVAEAISRVGLHPFDKKRFKKYSLGMKQRLGIAAAIMEQPDVILLDEPTNALDSEGILRLKEIIIEEKNRGAIVIVTCHDHDFLDSISDVIYKIDDGIVSRLE